MDQDFISTDKAEALIDEKLLIESLCHAVEQMQFNDELGQRISSALNRLSHKQDRRMAIIPKIQETMRDIKLDLELVKRGLVAIGQTGVMCREKIETELVREIFPPNQPQPGLGIVTIPEQTTSAVSIDCRSRLDLCKAACCRIFAIHLTAKEVHANVFHWDPKHPYELIKNPHGCSHLMPGTCMCNLYTGRPQTCRTYSCRDDQRIWADFDNRVLNPKLGKRLKTLEVSTEMPGIESGCHSTGTQGRTDNPRSEYPDRQVPPSSDDLEMPGVQASLPPGINNNSSPPDFSTLRTLINTEPRQRFEPTDGGSIEFEDDAMNSTGPSEASSPDPDTGPSMIQMPTGSK